jgi:hypothetical protein
MLAALAWGLARLNVFALALASAILTALLTFYLGSVENHLELMTAAAR